jgi:hypothetical protein
VGVGALRRSGRAIALAAALVAAGARGATAGTTIRSAADLRHLSLTPEVRGTLAALTDVVAVDAAPRRESGPEPPGTAGVIAWLTPFDASATHRFCIRGLYRGPDRVLAVQIPAHVLAASLRLGLDRDDLSACARIVAHRLPASRSGDREGLAGASGAGTRLVATSLSGTGEAHRVEAELTVEVRRDRFTFTGPVVHLLDAGLGTCEKAGPSAGDIVRCVESVVKDPVARALLERAGTGRTYALARSGGHLVLAIAHDERLGSASSLVIGGRYRYDPATGIGSLAHYTAPLDMIRKVRPPGLSRALDAPEARWIMARRTRAAHAYVEAYQAGCLVRMYTGDGFWVNIGAGDSTEVLASNVPDLEAHPTRPGAPPDELAEARARRFLGAARDVSSRADLEALLAATRENLAILLPLAEEALAVGDRARAGELAQRARRALAALRRDWRDAHALAASANAAAALARLRLATERCPPDPALWESVRALAIAMGRRIPAGWPPELDEWRHAGMGLLVGRKAIVPRLEAIARTLAPARSPAETAPGRPPDGQAGSLDGASGAGRGDLDAGAGAARAGAATCVATLRIGGTPLPARASARIVPFAIDGATLVPEAGLPPPVPGLPELLGPLARPALSAALRGRLWAARVGGAAAGGDAWAGVLVPALDAGVLHELTLAGARLTSGDVRALLAPRFRTRALPAAMAALALTFSGRRLSLRLQPAAGQVEAVLAALAHRDPFVKVEPDGLVMSRVDLVVRGGGAVTLSDP